MSNTERHDGKIKPWKIIIIRLSEGFHDSLVTAHLEVLLRVSSIILVLELATDFSEDTEILVMVTPWLRATLGSRNLKCSVPGL